MVVIIVVQFRTDVDPNQDYINFVPIAVSTWILLTSFEYCSVVILFTALYNFSYVIKNGAAYDIHANRFSTIILILHATLSVITTVTFGTSLYMTFNYSEALFAVTALTSWYSTIITQCSMLYVLN